MMSFAEELVSWYWTHGVQRSNAYRIDAGWLYRVREIGRRMRWLDGQLGAAAKPTTGLWGSSQAGKSTFISMAVDDRASTDSAINWSEERPYRLSGVDDGGRVKPINPYNLKSEATSVATRFVLAAEGEVDPEFPVQIKFAARRQLMIALALGFLHEVAFDGEIAYRIDDVREKLGDVGGRATGNGGGRWSPENVNALLEEVEALDSVVAFGAERFKQVAKAWSASATGERPLRDQLLAAAQEQGAFDVVRSLVYEYLWEGSPQVGKLLDDLLGVVAAIAPDGEACFCSHEVAAELLDIGAISQDNVQDPTHLARKTAIFSRFRLRNKNGRVYIYLGDHGQRAFPNRDLVTDFARLQGAVWEMAFPLHESFFAARSENALFCAALQFFKTSEAVDFPGAPNETRAEAVRLNLGQNPPELKLLTDLLKRGKTYGIIHEYTGQLSIDQFVIFNKSQGYAAKPDIQLAQVARWWSQSGRQTADAGITNAAKLPTYLVFSAFAESIAELMSGGQVLDGAIRGGFSQFANLRNSLGALATPANSTAIALSYPNISPSDRLNSGHIMASVEELIVAKLALEQNPVFQSVFASEISKSSFEAMFVGAQSRTGDGGVGFFLDVLSRVSNATLQGLRRAQRDALAATLAQLGRKYAPDEGDTTERARQCVAAAVATLERYVNGAESDEALAGRTRDLARYVKRLVSFAVEDVRPAPQARQDGPGDYKDYIQAEFETWKAQAQKLTPPSGLELDPQEFPTAVAQLALGRLASPQAAPSLPEWLRETFGRLQEIPDLRRVRLLIAVQLTNVLLPPEEVKPVRTTATRAPDDQPDGAAPVEVARIELMRDPAPASRPRAIAQRLQVEPWSVLRILDPDVRLVLDPFVKRLKSLAEADAIERETQIGDAELIQLLTKNRSAAPTALV